MTNEPSPRPWHLEGRCIYTAYGDFIGEMEHTDDARFVVDAANERDRLRDLVKRMAAKLKVHRGIFVGAGVWDETKQGETCDLIKEARAALRRKAT